MAKIDIGPTKGPEFKALAKSIAAGKDPYIKAAVAAKPLMLVKIGDDLRTQAVGLGAEAGKAAKTLHQNQGSLNELKGSLKNAKQEHLTNHAIGLGTIGLGATVAGTALYQYMTDESATLAGTATTALAGVALLGAGIVGESKSLAKTFNLKDDIDKLDQGIIKDDHDKQGIDRLHLASKQRLHLSDLAKIGKKSQTNIENAIKGHTAQLDTSQTAKERKTTLAVIEGLEEAIVSMGGDKPERESSGSSIQDDFHSRRQPESSPARARPEPTAEEKKQNDDSWLAGIEIPSGTGKANKGKKPKKKGASTNTATTNPVKQSPVKQDSVKQSPVKQDPVKQSPAESKNTQQATGATASRKPQQPVDTAEPKETQSSVGTTETKDTQPSADTAEPRETQKPDKTTSKKKTSAAPATQGPTSSRATQQAAGNAATEKIKQSLTPGEVVGTVSPYGDVFAGNEIRISEEADIKSLALYSPLNVNFSERFATLEERLQENPSNGKPLKRGKGQAKIYEMKMDNTVERLYFHHHQGRVEILGKSTKSDQDKIINRIQTALAERVRA